VATDAAENSKDVLKAAEEAKAKKRPNCGGWDYSDIYRR